MRLSIEQPKRRGDLVAIGLLGGGLTLLLALYIWLWVALLSVPALGGIDFISFYTAGRIARAGDYRQLYDLKTHYAIQSAILGPNYVPGGVIMSQHPPFLAPLLGLIALDDYRKSYVIWSVIVSCILAACGVVVTRLLAPAIDRRPRIVFAISAMLFYPVFISLLKGQDTAFVLLGALIWFWALCDRRDGLAGIALALVWLKPQIALALALPLIVSQRRAAWWFCGTSALLGLYSLALVGWAGLLDLLGLMRLSADGWGYGTNQQSMYNFLGLLIRAAPGLSNSWLDALKWAMYLLAIGGVCWLWLGKRSALDPLEIGLGVVACVFASPHLHFHDLSLLVLPALALIKVLWRGREWARAAALAILPASSLLLFASDFIPEPQHYFAGYALMLGLGVSLAALLWLARRTAGLAQADAPHAKH